MLQTVRAEKVDENMGLSVYFHVSFLIYGPLNYLKNKYFAILCWPKKFRSMKTIYIYASEKSLYAFSENGIVYAIKHCFEDIRVWSRWI